MLKFLVNFKFLFRFISAEWMDRGPYCSPAALPQHLRSASQGDYSRGVLGRNRRRDYDHGGEAGTARHSAGACLQRERGRRRYLGARLNLKKSKHLFLENEFKLLHTYCIYLKKFVKISYVKLI